MPVAIIKLSISKNELLKYYAGTAKSVVATSESGQRVRFPAQHLRCFVTQEGIQGRFAIEYSRDGKFQSIAKLNE